nr:hypothetical protein [uncultured Methanospirillum sp.]
MVNQKADRVLIIVGIILVVAIIGCIAAAAIIPTPADEPTLKQVKLSSTGQSAGASPCCKTIPQGSSGCGSARSVNIQG